MHKEQLDAYNVDTVVLCKNNIHNRIDLFPIDAST